MWTRMGGRGQYLRHRLVLRRYRNVQRVGAVPVHRLAVLVLIRGERLAQAWGDSLKQLGMGTMRLPVDGGQLGDWTEELIGRLA